MDELSKTLVPAISSFVGALSIHLFQRYYRKKDEEKERQYRKDDEIKLESVKNSIREISEIKTYKEKMISESQFKLYSDLWKNLNNLELMVDELWCENLSSENLKRFKESLMRTGKKVDDSAIILDAKHYNKLSEILNKLIEYQNGKKKLIDIEVNDEDSEKVVQSLISGNFDLRCEFIDLKKEILVELRKGLGFTSQN